MDKVQVDVSQCPLRMLLILWLSAMFVALLAYMLT